MGCLFYVLNWPYKKYTFWHFDGARNGRMIRPIQNERGMVLCFSRNLAQRFEKICA